MKDRIALLAGLVSEDDFDEVRDRVVESYEKQLEEDVKEFSEHVSVVQEDKYVFSKLLSEMKEQPDLSGEMYGEYTSLPLSAIEALEAVAKGGDELIRHNNELRDEFLKRELIFLDTEGQFTLTDKAYDFLGVAPVSEAFSYRMNNGSHFVTHHPDNKEMRMNNDVSDEKNTKEFPRGWKFYENDPTYLKLMAKMEDPLDLGEQEYLVDKFADFVKKYEKKEKKDK
jgi:hypothetical protein